MSSGTSTVERRTLGSEMRSPAAPHPVELLRLNTCGSVDDGKSTLIGRLLYDSKSLMEDQLEALERSADITGGGQPQGAPPQQSHGPNNSNGQNGYDNSPDRFPLHRRRRRHRGGGPRDNSMSGEGGDTSSGPRQSDD